jgi:hypothetical protein
MSGLARAPWLRLGEMGRHANSSDESDSVDLARRKSRRVHLALVGGLIYKSTKSNEEKANFVTNLQKTNLEREKAHLKPLDWCSEAYKFDKGWATENQECGQRIAAYEAGDKTALVQ